MGLVTEAACSLHEQAQLKTDYQELSTSFGQCAPRPVRINAARCWLPARCPTCQKGKPLGGVFLGNSKWRCLLTQASYGLTMAKKKRRRLLDWTLLSDGKPLGVPEERSTGTLPQIPFDT
jgi:hypothetical protein